MSAKEWKVGDHVAWDHAQGTSEGRIVRIAKEPGTIEDFRYVASEDDPRYIVESGSTGARAAHKGEELREAD
ncbi:MAG TPA: DUF2945 domain-containing protein [Candidatus Thermoplasmatota archaeon]|jgi:hypothetical protein|nr:DUF2945 domain-containing protein [Candidatus Thermoplasmatota archaeon]